MATQGLCGPASRNLNFPVAGRVVIRDFPVVNRALDALYAENRTRARVISLPHLLFEVI